MPPTRLWSLNTGLLGQAANPSRSRLGSQVGFSVIVADRPRNALNAATHDRAVMDRFPVPYLVSLADGLKLTKHSSSNWTPHPASLAGSDFPQSLLGNADTPSCFGFSQSKDELVKERSDRIDHHHSLGLLRRP